MCSDRFFRLVISRAVEASAQRIKQTLRWILTGIRWLVDWFSIRSKVSSIFLFSSPFWLDHSKIVIECKLDCIIVNFRDDERGFCDRGFVKNFIAISLFCQEELAVLRKIHFSSVAAHKAIEIGGFAIAFGA